MQREEVEARIKKGQKSRKEEKKKHIEQERLIAPSDEELRTDEKKEELRKKLRQKIKGQQATRWNRERMEANQDTSDALGDPNMIAKVLDQVTNNPALLTKALQNLGLNQQTITQIDPNQLKLLTESLGISDQKLQEVSSVVAQKLGLNESNSEIDNFKVKSSS